MQVQAKVIKIIRTVKTVARSNIAIEDKRESCRQNSDGRLLKINNRLIEQKLIDYFD